MSDRFGDYELIEVIDVCGGGLLWLARDGDGELCDLYVVDESRDDVDEAYFRGDDWPRLREIGALDDPRFAKPVGEPLRFEQRNAIRFAHTPLLRIDELRRRAIADRGIALPLVVTLVRDVVGGLIVAQAHGLTGFDWFAVGVDGRARLFDAGPGSARDDLRHVGAEAASLAFGGGVPRDDIPVQLTSALAWTLSTESTPSAAAIREWLDDDELDWTKWTPEQVIAELRALFPDLGSRR